MKRHRLFLRKHIHSSFATLSMNDKIMIFELDENDLLMSPVPGTALFSFKPGAHFDEEVKKVVVDIDKQITWLEVEADTTFSRIETMENFSNDPGFKKIVQDHLDAGWLDYSTTKL